MVRTSSSGKQSFKDSSSHSFGKIPQGNLGSKASHGDKRTQPRAEFRGKKVERLYYEPEHGSHNELFVHSKATRANEMPYTKRKPIPLDIPRSGVVTLADAHVIRQRNLPLLFSKQLKEVGRFQGPPVLKQVYSILFPTGHVYKSQDPAYRPKAGCIQTYFWDDNQIKVWGHFASSYGITYSGKTEYSFPSGLLGKLVHNGVYSSDKPWPTAKNPGALVPVTKMRTHRSHKRSVYKRILRSLSKRSKEFVIKPLSIEQVVTVRKTLSRKEIDRRYDRSQPISSYRESVPNCLSIAFGPPAQISQIVLDSLRKIYSTPKKFLEDLSWIIPKEKPVEYVLQMKVAPKKAELVRPRKIVVLNSDQGGVFRAMVGTGHQLYLVDTNYQGIIKTPEERSTVIKNFHKWQEALDDDPEKYEDHSGPLGGWFDQP